MTVEAQFTRIEALLYRMFALWLVVCSAGIAVVVEESALTDVQYAVIGILHLTLLITALLSLWHAHAIERYGTLRRLWERVFGSLRTNSYKAELRGDAE